MKAKGMHTNILCSNRKHTSSKVSVIHYRFTENVSPYPLHFSVDEEEQILKAARDNTTQFIRELIQLVWTCNHIGNTYFKSDSLIISI